MNPMYLIGIESGGDLHLRAECAEIQINCGFGALKQVHRCSLGSLSWYLSGLRSASMNQMNFNVGGVGFRGDLPCEAGGAREALRGMNLAEGQCTSSSLARRDG